MLHNLPISSTIAVLFREVKMNVNGLNGSYNSASSSATYIKVSGLEQSGSMDTTKAGDIATAASNNSVVVNISDNAKVALAQATAEQSFKDVGIVAREVGCPQAASRG
jgi:hypothetical protein